MNLRTEQLEDEETHEKDTHNHQDIIPILSLKQLKVLTLLGRGAKGVVFHVRFQSQDLALKVISKDLIKIKSNRKINDQDRRKSSRTSSNSDGSCRNIKIRNNHNIICEESRIGFEQLVLSRLNHPLLPKLHGVLETEKIVGYAINYCPGRDLNNLRKRQTEKMFSDDIIRFYGAELVLALEYLHGLGIVYRDLKPENIMIQENGHLMLVDFDLSTELPPPKSPREETVKRQTLPAQKISNHQSKSKKSKVGKKFRLFCNAGISPVDSDLSTRSRIRSTANSMKPGVQLQSVDNSSSTTTTTRRRLLDDDKSNSFVGTEEYVAPEVIQGNGHDFSVDWWCLGIVLHEMLYGTTPFRGSNRKETFYRIISKKPELVGEMTPLRDLIRRLLEKDPKERINVEEIKGHEFFKGINWEMLLKIQRPPFVPFPREFVAEEVDNMGMDGIMEIDVEGIVEGIFKNGGENGNKKKDSGCNNQNRNNIDGDQLCGNNGSNGGDGDHGEKIIVNKGDWAEGLQQSSYDQSEDFLVF